jgi:hypothetical protein
MTPTRAIFRSTQQAIAFSYMVSTLPARDGGALGKLLDRMQLEATGKLEEREVSSISFAGLSDMEVRGQCAMVRAAVENLLPSPESWAIRARFGVAFIDRASDRTIKSATYGPDRTRAMRNLAKYLAPSLDTISSDAILMLIARTCGECDELRPTFRQIEAEVGTPKSTAERAEKKVKHRVRNLVNLGVDRLTPLFERDGLVGDDE